MFESTGILAFNYKEQARKTGLSEEEYKFENKLCAFAEIKEATQKTGHTRACPEKGNKAVIQAESGISEMI